jgi:hypothetical protein
MRIFRTSALLGALAVASPGAAQTGGMNNSAGGAGPSNIPGSMGSGTAENSPREKPGAGEARGDGRTSVMKTPTPDGAATSGTGRDGHVIGE